MTRVRRSETTSAFDPPLSPRSLQRARAGITCIETRSTYRKQPSRERFILCQAEEDVFPSPPLISVSTTSRPSDPTWDYGDALARATATHGRVTESVYHSRSPAAGDVDASPTSSAHSVLLGHAYTAVPSLATTSTKPSTNHPLTPQEIELKLASPSLTAPGSIPTAYSAEEPSSLLERRASSATRRVSRDCGIRVESLGR